VLDAQSVFNIIAGGALAAMGWFARTLWDSISKLRSELAGLREDIPKSYVAKVDYRDDMREVKRLLESIRDILDRKADK
jgi:hypothetical protein